MPKQPNGARPQTRTIHTSVTEDTYAVIVEEAAKRGLSLNAFVGQMLANAGLTAPGDNRSQFQIVIDLRATRPEAEAIFAAVVAVGLPAGSRSQLIRPATITKEPR